MNYSIIQCSLNKVPKNDMTLGMHGMLSAGEVRRSKHTSFQTPLAPNSGTWAAAWQLLERRWSYQIYLTIRKAEVFSSCSAPFQGSVSHKAKRFLSGLHLQRVCLSDIPQVMRAYFWFSVLAEH